ISAKQAPVTRPTYPEPIIEISMNPEWCGRMRRSTSGGIRPAVPPLFNLDQLPCEPGSKFKSKPNLGKALRVTVKRRPYYFTPLLSRITPPKDATQLVKSRYIA